MRQVLILGAGFGGLELATRLSESLRDEVRVTIVDQNDSFVFGFSKLAIAFGRQTREQVRCPYRDITRPGIEFRQERVTSIDPQTRHVVTNAGTYEPDILIVALGADYDPAATPGFVADGHEYYSVAAAERLSEVLASFHGGRVLIAILGVPFKCPPAPYEGALLLHDYLLTRGVRDATTIHVISPMPSPIPVSKETSEAIVQALDERGIDYTPSHRVTELDPTAHVARLKTGDLPYDLFIGIPIHRAPAVVEQSGLTEGGTDGWVAVDPHNLTTRFPDVYALGDCADAPVPRAGVFAETAARAVADDITAKIRGTGPIAPYDGKGSCYIEFGQGIVGKVDADFLSGPAPTAPFLGPSRELAAEKEQFTRIRRRRWFGTQ
ncbi:NAD(P)/FAD-dependent oxidoreductase [Phytohabitans rumicis]|uniref:Pyridine nucleotide-disulfide oxidoreductase n=1 Tax=Phytohabitans rumicis TaxID=1076125 RepID=A0A6V8KXT6_9ACTN|nr:FAD-dependent oxidoreductase [Phytohabitans rumicis]GFJ87251.1 pyridine nucleotide-disulfide oxidoreductase [Phytohabitans rumicis]